MAATCFALPAHDAREGVYCQQRILKSTTGWAERLQVSNSSCLTSNKHNSESTSTYGFGGRSYRYGRYHTANSVPPTKSKPASRILNSYNESRALQHQVSVLVADLLQFLAAHPPPYGSLPVTDTDNGASVAGYEEEARASARIISDDTAPPLTIRHRVSKSPQRGSGKMDFDIDFGSTSGFKSHGKKKKAAPAAKFDPWGDSSGDKKDDTAANGSGGDGDGAGAGNGGDAAGSGGGGDDNNNGGGNDDDDAWGFSTNKKDKKKTKKQLEEEEAERKKQEEEAASKKADPLDWANDANGDGAGDDWTMSWGGTKAKSTKKKDSGTTGNFESINLDDSGPKIDFFDGLGDTSKKTDSSGFGGWGKSWDFGGAADKPATKKEESSDFGTNNPWGLGGSKTTTKKSTMSNFDFGDFATSNDADAAEETKAVDDTWGFTSSKSKTKKKGIEEIKEEPKTDKVDDTWGGWSAGGAAKTKANKAEPANDSSFDWGFGTKTKKNDLFGEISPPPKDTSDDWMSSGWGTDKKKGKKGLLDDEFLPEAPEPPPAAEPEPESEPLIAWDEGLNTKERKKKERSMKLDGTWESRITVEMVEAAAEKAKAAEAALLEPEPEPIPEPEPEPEPEPVPALPSLANEVAWNHGLSAVKSRKREKEMKLDGTWESRITQEMIDDAKAAEAEAAAVVEPDPVPEPEPEPEVLVLEEDSTPLEDLVPWDQGLNSKDKKKKQKELVAAGTWDDRLTQDKIDQMIADRDAAAASAVLEPELEPEPIPEPEPEPEPEVLVEPQTPLEDLVPWDDGANAKERKKREKEMRLAGTWEDRLTRDKIDQMIADRDAAALVEPEPEPEPIPEVEPEPELEPENATPVETLEEAEALLPWDHGITKKSEKKKKQMNMMADGTWEDRLTPEVIEERIAAARAAQEAAVAAVEPDPEPQPEAEPEPEPELEAAALVETVEEAEALKPWDDGLNAKEKKAKKKNMEKDGTWDERLTQADIDERIANARAAQDAASPAEPDPEPEVQLDLELEPMLEEPIPEPAPEPRFPWDHGLGPKEKKKKEKAMKLDGTWNSRLTQEQIDEEAAAAEAALAASAAAEPEPEPVPEVPAEDAGGWGFSGWGGGKPKGKNKSLLDPEPEPAADDGWGGGWFGKKKTPVPSPVIEAPPSPPPEPEFEPAPVSAKDKKKKSKKADLEEPTPASADNDPWATFEPKADKSAKKSKKGLEEDLVTTVEPEAAPEVPAVDDFDWEGLGTGKKSKKTPIEEAPAKKSSSSLWGFGSSSSTAKTKKEKEAKAKKDAEEQAQKDEEERLQREIDAEEAAVKAEEEAIAAAEEANKTEKKSKSAKSSKSKLPEKNDDLLDLLDDTVTSPKSSSSKLKKTSTKSSDKQLDEVAEEAAPATDYFSFWGSKKTSGKKSTDDKKEIKAEVLTNEEDALLAELNEDEIQAILDDSHVPGASKPSKTMSSGKSKVTGTIADRVKAFETKKEDVGKKSKSKLVIEEAEAEPETALSPKELKLAAKSKSSSAKSSKAQVDQPPSPPPDVEQKRSKDSVPGGFPDAFDDDLLAEEVDQPEPVKKKSSKVEKKASAKVPSSKKKSQAEAVKFAEPETIPETIPDLLDEPAASSPPGDSEKKSSSRKERPRVERSATTSWGFWGASAPPPKKPTRSKTLDDVSPAESKKKSPPAIVRTKSTKSSKSKETEESKDAEPSKTSGSEKESSAKQSAKASKGMSFSNFMLGTAPPSAMKPSGAIRRSSTSGSKSSSRRQSIRDTGLMSPPPEDESPVTSKAAKLMGFGALPTRRSSTREKSRAVPDPYPIDDDDMVMIADKPTAPPIKQKSRSRPSMDTKRTSGKPRSRTLTGEDDTVMVDSPIAMDSANEDFVAPALQRSNTGGRKSLFNSLTGGLFGGAAAARATDRSRSMPATDNEDNAPTRSRGNSHRRSRVLSPADGFTTDAPGETDADAAARRAERRAKKAAAAKAEEDDRAAREARRRERRDREKADLEARREKARDQARKEREAEEVRKEERRARRREKEAAERDRIAQEEAAAEADAQRRREERRALREKLQAEANIAPISKEERRRTFAEEEPRRRRKDEGKSRPKSTGRKSTVLMAEYHESRSGSGRGIKPPADKTSSWIASQNDEPPEMPPLEPTVIDASGQAPRPVDDPRRRRKDKYAGMDDDEIAAAREKRRERKVLEKSTSGGSDEKTQRKSRRSSRIIEDDFYANDNVKTFDGRPQTAKRSSFLGKFF